MADLESRVDKLETEVQNLKLDTNRHLVTIQADVKEIKSSLTSSTENEALRKQIIANEVDSNKERIKKLEDNQSKLVWTIIIEVIGVIGAAVIAYLRMGG